MLAFAVIYMLVAIAGTFAMLISGLDLTSAATSAASCLTLLGAGLGGSARREGFAPSPRAGASS